jgi:hypothetical protein
VLRPEGKPMCLNSTIDFIDFDDLTPKEKKKLHEHKKKLQERKRFLQKRIEDIEKGLIKLDKKLKR